MLRTNFAIGQFKLAKRFSCFMPISPAGLIATSKLWEINLASRLVNNRSMQIINKRMSGVDLALETKALILNQNPIVKRAVLRADDSDIASEAHRFLKEFNEHGAYNRKDAEGKVTDDFSKFIRIDTAGEYDIHQLLGTDFFVLHLYLTVLTRRPDDKKIQLTVDVYAYKCFVLSRAIELDNF